MLANLHYSKNGSVTESQMNCTYCIYKYNGLDPSHPLQNERFLNDNIVSMCMKFIITQLFDCILIYIETKKVVFRSPKVNSDYQ